MKVEQQLFFPDLSLSLSPKVPAAFFLNHVSSFPICKRKKKMLNSNRWRGGMSGGGSGGGKKPFSKCEISITMRRKKRKAKKGPLDVRHLPSPPWVTFPNILHASVNFAVLLLSHTHILEHPPNCAPADQNLSLSLCLFPHLPPWKKCCCCWPYSRDGGGTLGAKKGDGLLLLLLLYGPIGTHRR